MSQPRYDLEDMLFEVADMLKSNLNTEIQLITTEKDDGIELRTIADNAYAIQSMDDKVMNYADFVFMDIEALESEGLGPETSEKFGMLVLLVTSQINDKNQVRKVLRYGKALKRTFEKNWKSATSRGIKLQIQSIPTQDLQLLNSTKQYKTAGVIVTGAIG